MDFIALSQQCAPVVDVKTIAAIVRTESAFNPYRIGVNKGGRLKVKPSTLEVAVAEASRLIAEGANIDMGLGQINSANLPRLGLSVREVFDPCINLKAAATILHGNYVHANPAANGEQQALKMALSAYNTGSETKGFKNGYVDKVVNNADAVKVPAINTGSYKELTSEEVDSLDSAFETEQAEPNPFGFNEGNPFKF